MKAKNIVARVGSIRPNPFRRIERYPISKEKVTALRRSIRDTGFWDNVVARVGPDGPEIAYGHHRLEAVKQELGSEAEVSLIVRDLDDETMLKIMANENMTEWQTDAAVTVETVRAVRDFLISGPARKSGNAAKPNGIEDIAAFLGWTKNKVADALQIIRAEEQGHLKPEDTAGLGLTAATVLSGTTRKIKDPKVKAKAIAKVRAEVKSGEATKRHVEATVWETRIAAVPVKAKAKVPRKVAQELNSEIAGFWKRSIDINGTRQSRLKVAQAIAANRNAAQLHGYIKPIIDNLVEMNRINTELIALLQNGQAIEEAV